MEHSSSDLVTLGAVILLGFIVIPVWMAMGLADYFCHRATRIEQNAGTRESLLHLVQFGSVAVPLTAAFFFSVNATVLLLMIVFIVVHHIVAFVDVRYANAVRGVPPIEQMVHSFLELLPITAFLLIGTLEFDQLQALFGAGESPADFALRLRRPPLPWWYVLSVLAAAMLVNFVPYIEELVRCIRTDRARKALSR